MTENVRSSSALVWPLIVFGCTELTNDTRLAKFWIIDLEKLETNDYGNLSANSVECWETISDVLDVWYCLNNKLANLKSSKLFPFIAHWMWRAVKRKTVPLSHDGRLVHSAAIVCGQSWETRLRCIMGTDIIICDSVTTDAGM